MVGILGNDDDWKRGRLRRIGDEEMIEAGLFGEGDDGSGKVVGGGER